MCPFQSPRHHPHLRGSRCPYPLPRRPKPVPSVQSRYSPPRRSASTAESSSIPLRSPPREPSALRPAVVGTEESANTLNQGRPLPLPLQAAALGGLGLPI